MTPRRVLLVDTKGAAPANLPAILARETEGGIAAELTTEVYEAVHRISDKGFDAVICWAEHKDDLIGVIQIRKARPSLPIVVLSAQENPGFAALATQMGATRVSKLEGELSLVTQTIRLAVSSSDLALEVQARASEQVVRVREMQRLIHENRMLARSAHAQVKRNPSSMFVPLLVEDDPNEALLMARALKRANVFAPLPILASGEEAIAYLSDLGDSGGQTLPPPSMIILDLKLPQISSLRVLEWIRGNPSVAHIPVVVLSDSTNPDYVDRAYQSGAQFYLLKPSSLDALVQLIANLAGL